jgi:hypothetical protein
LLLTIITCVCYETLTFVFSPSLPYLTLPYQALLLETATALKTLARTHNVAVVIVNAAVSGNEATHSAGDATVALPAVKPHRLYQNAGGDGGSGGGGGGNGVYNSGDDATAAAAASSHERVAAPPPSYVKPMLGDAWR